ARETRAGAKRGCLKQLCATTILKNAAGNQLLISQRIPLVHYALERMQVSYNGEHQQHPLLYPLVLANREELIQQGCTFKLKSADLQIRPS
ncbi:hypothetical protein ACV1DV_22995, partial [Aeromonas veronii]